MVKLIASDMDGTLLDSNKSLNPQFNEVLNELKNKDIVFVAISGRDLQSLKVVFKEEDGIIFASNNGNYITYKGEVLHENVIQKDKLFNIIPILRKHAKRNTIYCSKNTVYSESIMPCIAGLKFKLKVKKVNDIRTIDDDIIKITVFGNSKMLKNTMNEINLFKDKLMIAPSGSTCFDICELNGHKGNAIKFLQEKFNIKYEETMVFGDHMNDLEMMNHAYYSYAMENAKTEVKKNANFMAKNNDENGVLEVIKNIVLNKNSSKDKC